MLFLRRAQLSRILLTSFLTLVGLATAAHAAVVTATASSTGSQPLNGTLTIDDGIDPGNLVISFSLNAGQGDIRAFLTQVADESLIPGLSVVGYNNRSSQFKQDGIGKSSKSRGLGQSGSSCPCDFGLKFPAQTGTTISFTLTHSTVDLTLGLFYGQDFAIKAAKIQLEDGPGNGKSKGIKTALLQGRVPNVIPEPTTAVFMVLGLAGLSYGGRSRAI